MTPASVWPRRIVTGWFITADWTVSTTGWHLQVGQPGTPTTHIRQFPGALRHGERRKCKRIIHASARLTFSRVPLGLRASSPKLIFSLTLHHYPILEGAVPPGHARVPHITPIFEMSFQPPMSFVTSGAAFAETTLSTGCRLRRLFIRLPHCLRKSTKLRSVDPQTQTINSRFFEKLL